MSTHPMPGKGTLRSPRAQDRSQSPESRRCAERPPSPGSFAKSSGVPEHGVIDIHGRDVRDVKSLIRFRFAKRRCAGGRWAAPATRHPWEINNPFYRYLKTQDFVPLISGRLRVLP